VGPNNIDSKGEKSVQEMLVYGMMINLDLLYLVIVKVMARIIAEKQSNNHEKYNLFGICDKSIFD
jgi:hypothetical protein